MEEQKKEQVEMSVLQQAEATAKRIEEANKTAAELLDKQEKLLSKIILSGRATTGIEIKEVDPVKEAFDDKVKKIMANVGR